MEHSVLLTPPITKAERFGKLTDAGAVMPGLGVLSIAACLREQGFPVSVIDAEGIGLDMQATVQRIARLRPKIVGVTSTALSFHSAVAVSMAIKKQLPWVVTVLGGPHVTAFPGETLENYECIDAVVVGDGEASFSKLVRNVLSGVTLHKGINGIFYREDGEIRFTPKTGHLEDLDSLPFPAWDLLEGFPSIYRPPFHSYRKLPVANIITARGCPWMCSFCDRSVFGRKVVRHSIEYVVEMIEYLVHRFHIQEISIKDDTFTTSAERVSEFANLLKKKRIEIYWSCNARITDVNEPMLKDLKKSGCWLISYGIESGSPLLLKKMHKGITREQVIRALRLTRKCRITSKGFFMIGVPGETTETLRETRDFINNLSLDEISLNYYTPFPGSQLYREVIKEGFQPDFGRMNMQEVVYVPKGLTKDDLQHSFQSIVYRFYLQPGKVLAYMLRAVKDYNEMRRVYRMGKVFIRLLYSSVKTKILGQASRGDG